MIQAISNLFGAIIRVIFDLVGNNYALSIILFAILTKLLLFPLNLKQAKSMKEMKKVGPLEQEIRKKHKGDKEKMAVEVQKLYSEHKINPLAGCLPALIQIPMVLAMFYIVKQPLTYIVQTPKSEIVQYTKEITGKEEVKDSEIKNYEIQIANDKKLINMNFAGFNFGDIPANSIAKGVENKPSKWTLVIPALSLLLSILQTRLAIKNGNMTEEQIQQQKTMNLMLPFLSAYISYIMPLALGVYWLIGNICQIAGQQITTLIVDGKDNKKDKKVMLDGRREEE